MEREQSFIRIEVADKGPGIPEENLGKIFEAGFTQGKANGTGLGLSICKQIVEAHGGTIRAENIVERDKVQGARFVIELSMPLERQEAIETLKKLVPVKNADPHGNEVNAIIAFSPKGDILFRLGFLGFRTYAYNHMHLRKFAQFIMPDITRPNGAKIPETTVNWTRIKFTYDASDKSLREIQIFPPTVANYKGQVSIGMEKFKGLLPRNERDLSEPFESNRNEIIMAARLFYDAIVGQDENVAKSIVVQTSRRHFSEEVDRDGHIPLEKLAALPLADQAMNATKQHLVLPALAQPYNGGIDLNQINVKPTGKTINVQFDPAQLNELEKGNFRGFTLVITGFQYIQSPFLLLGINNPAKAPEVLMKA